MTNAIERLLALADEYGRAANLPESTVSWRVFADTKKLAAIRTGADLATGRYERAVAWFAENWPEGAAWPPAIDRPRFETAGARG